MKTIPLTVLAHEGPGSRAYLVMMGEAGFRPSSIIVMIASHGEIGGNGKRVGRFLPNAIRTRYTNMAQEVRRMYWPRRIQKEHPALYEAIVNGLSSLIKEPRQRLDAITGKFNWNHYSDSVNRITVKDYKDEGVLQALQQSTVNNVLFTGGGIIPKSLIESANRFIHIHPGKLPHVRGADGILWSTLVRGRPGATCFYMSDGIDTGNIIETHDLPATTFQISEDDRPNDQTLYRAIFSFYDPLLRAKVFSDILTKHHGYLPDSGWPQSNTEGTTYHFMHPAIRKKALSRIFVTTQPG
ncbi:uncharacterized protein METZ01_LOCUS274025 [marine metagenome]|uniref:Formyl transferase N-terminal domain-containing protein n=1 Tax=marine metagenome TaxID=408172 RepID=A0A382KEL5_9ZZZZ